MQHTATDSNKRQESLATLTNAATPTAVNQLPMEPVSIRRHPLAEATLADEFIDSRPQSADMLNDNDNDDNNDDAEEESRIQSRSVDALTPRQPAAAASADNNTSWRTYCVIALRSIFPVLLFCATAVRFTLPSYIYGFLFLTFMASYGFRPADVVERAVTALTLLVSLCMCISHIVFQLVAAFVSITPSTATVLFGFQRPDNFINALQYIVPDVVIFVYSLGLLYTLNQSKNIESSNFNARLVYTDKYLYIVRCIMACLMIVLLLAIGVSAVTLPNILSIPYLMFLMIECISWVSPSKAKRTLRYQRAGLLLYNVLHMMTLYGVQLYFMQKSVDEKSGFSTLSVFGLFPIFQQVYTNVNQYSYLDASILLFVLTTIHGRLQRAYIDQNSSSFVAYVKRFGIGSLIAPGVTRFSKSSFTATFTRYLLDNASKLGAAVLFAYAISYPTFLTIPLLFWSCLTLVSNGQLFSRTAFFMLMYTVAITFVQYIFSLNGVDLGSFSDAGLVRRTTVDLSAQLAMIFLFTFTCRPWESIVARQMNTSRDNLSCRSIRQRAGSLGSTVPMTVASTTKGQFWLKLRLYVGLAWEYLSYFLLKYAYFISLVVLYVCGLQQVNVLNAIFSKSYLFNDLTFSPLLHIVPDLSKVCAVRMDLLGDVHGTRNHPTILLAILVCQELVSCVSSIMGTRDLG